MPWDVHEGVRKTEQELLRVRAPVFTRVLSDLRDAPVQLRQQGRFFRISLGVVLVSVPLDVRRCRVSRELNTVQSRVAQTHVRRNPMRGLVHDAGEKEEGRGGTVLLVPILDRILQRLMDMPREKNLREGAALRSATIPCRPKLGRYHDDRR